MEHVSIEAVGDALDTLAQEMDHLVRLEDTLMQRRDLLLQKLIICHDTLSQLYTQTTGHAPQLRDHPKFPELTD